MTSLPGADGPCEAREYMQESMGRWPNPQGILSTDEVVELRRRCDDGMYDSVGAARLLARRVLASGDL